MRKVSIHSKSSGLTLVEAVIVVVVLICLWVLIVPTLSRAQIHPPSRVCLLKVRGIPVALPTYSFAWDGWTHPDLDYYVKLFGYKLSHEDGYDAVRQGTTRDFVCLLDAKPSHAHGVATSYIVLPEYVGVNLLGKNFDASKTAAAREIVFRHPWAPNEGRLGAHVAFADGHAVLMTAREWQDRRREIGESVGIDAVGPEPISDE